MTEPLAVEAAEAAPETHPFVANGRTVQLRGLKESQILQMQHEAQILQSETIGVERKMQALERVRRGLFSTVIDPDELAYIEDQMIDGTVDLEQFMEAVTSTMSPSAKTPKLRRGSTSRGR